MEELLSSSVCRVFASVNRQVRQLFTALFQHNLITLMSRRSELNALKSMAAQTHNGFTHTWKWFGPRNTCHYQSFCKGESMSNRTVVLNSVNPLESLFSWDHMQAQVLRKSKTKLLSPRDRNESSPTRWLIYSCNFLTLPHLKGQLMEMHTRKHSYESRLRC